MKMNCAKCDAELAEDWVTCPECNLDRKENSRKLKLDYFLSGVSFFTLVNSFWTGIYDNPILIVGISIVVQVGSYNFSPLKRENMREQFGNWFPLVPILIQVFASIFQQGVSYGIGYWTGYLFDLLS